MITISVIASYCNVICSNTCIYTFLFVVMAAMEVLLSCTNIIMLLWLLTNLVIWTNRHYNNSWLCSNLFVWLNRIFLLIIFIIASTICVFLRVLNKTRIIEHVSCFMFYFHSCTAEVVNSWPWSKQLRTLHIDWELWSMHVLSTTDIVSINNLYLLTRLATSKPDTPWQQSWDYISLSNSVLFSEKSER